VPASRKTNSVGDGFLTRARAATEILRREKSRDSLIEYSQAIEIPGAPLSEDPDEWMFKPIESSVALHHRVIMKALQACIEEDYGRLMIFAPPGSAKSSYAAVVAPTWAMGKYPGLRVLAASYASRPIIRASKRARQICASELYENIWDKPTTIVKGSNAADEWELTNGSGFFAAGLLAGITSSRCDLGLIDDAVAGREEAESEGMRKKTLDAYYDDFLSRLKPKASLAMIQTRWHQSDLAGCILPENYKGESGRILCRDGQTWNVISIPAQADRDDDVLGREKGEYLWPEWFSNRHWEMYKAKPRTWSSLYQQSPTPDEGIYFKREKFRRHKAGSEPEGMQMYMASDFATKEEAGDYTVHAACGVDSTGDLYVTSIFRKQVETDVSIPAAIDMIRDTKPTLWLGEKGPIESAIGPDIKNTMRRRRTFAARELLPSITNKVQRARGIIARVAAGTVSIVEGVDGDQLIEECVAFPGGRHDDGVDCLSLLGRALDQMYDGRAPEKEPEQHKSVLFNRQFIENQRREDEREKRERDNYYT
jgi:predicted phage terminase large subunit-like protein